MRWSRIDVDTLFLWYGLGVIVDFDLTYRT